MFCAIGAFSYILRTNYFPPFVFNGLAGLKLTLSFLALPTRLSPKMPFDLTDLIELTDLTDLTEGAQLLFDGDSQLFFDGVLQLFFDGDLQLCFEGDLQDFTVGDLQDFTEGDLQDFLEFGEQLLGS